METMTISALADAGGVGVETIRFYQRRGLLDTPARGAGIRSAQAAGFTLDGIAELLALDATQDRSRVRSLATERIAALDARIAELQQARDALAVLAQRCGRGGRGPCPILGAFDAQLEDD